MAKKNDNKQIKIKLTGSLIGASETQKAATIREEVELSNNHGYG